MATKLTLSMGYDAHAPVFELCVKQEIADESCVVPMMSLSMSGGDIQDVQTAINVINKFSLSQAEQEQVERADAEGPIV